MSIQDDLLQQGKTISDKLSILIHGMSQQKITNNAYHFYLQLIKRLRFTWTHAAQYSNVNPWEFLFGYARKAAFLKFLVDFALFSSM